MRSLRWGVVTAGLIVAGDAGAQATKHPSPGLPAPEVAPTSIGPAYSSDSDGDGVMDAWDTCPTGAVTPKPDTRSREPGCYFAHTNQLSWVAAEYQDPNGPGWSVTLGCDPALVVPVDDITVDHQRLRGIVVIGTSFVNKGKAASRAHEGRPWPDYLPAKCLLSVDFGGTFISSVGVTGESLATLYALWNPYLSVTPDPFSPGDTLGLIKSGITKVNTRDDGRPVVERLPFSRGVLYGDDLGKTQVYYVARPGLPTDVIADPTKGLAAPRPDPWTLVAHPITDLATPAAGERVLLAPGDWSLLPNDADALLQSDRLAMKKAFTGPTLPAPKGIYDSIEALPSIVLDDRWPAHYASLSAQMVLPTGANFFLPAVWRSPASPSAPWQLVPSAIVRTNQTRESSALHPEAPAQYAPAVGSPLMTLVLQNFRVASRSDTYLRHLESTWPGDNPIIARSEAHPDYGIRWMTNAPVGPAATDGQCWVTHWVGSDSAESFASYPRPFNTLSTPGDDVVAGDWCQSRLDEWWQHSYNGKTQTHANGVCIDMQHQVDALGEGATTVSSLVSLETAACTAFKSVISHVKDAFCCGEWVATAGVLGDGDCCVSILAPGADTIEAQAQCTMDWYAAESHDRLTNDIHWLDASADPKTMIPVIGLVRSGTQPETSVEAHMTPGGDQFLNRAHQGNDWNWRLSRFAIDPLYRSFAYRSDDDVFNDIENELELLIPQGRWNEARRPEDAPLDLHGHGAAYYVLHSGDVDHLGQVWPNELCGDFGIDRDSVPGDEGGKADNPTWPTANCGDQLYTSVAWRMMYGRSMFPPITPETLTGEALRMSIDQGWPGVPGEKLGAYITLGFQDWSSVELDGRIYANFPHRLAFLGRPILDCGHGGYQVEIHPPHVMTMDAQLMRDDATHSSGVISQAFGWVNPTVDGHFEFDLWPPPRPSGAARLIVLGADKKLNHLATGAAGDFGYIIDDTGPTHQGAPSTLVCKTSPADFPTHLHCAYDDPSPALWSGPLDLQHDNPRMLPAFASSRFDLRVYLGWSQ